MLVDSIKMGFSDLKKRKFRTFLTAFSIGIGTMLLIVMFGLGEGIQKMYKDNLSKFDTFKIVTVVNREPGKTNADGIKEDGKEKKLDRTTVDAIKKIAGVNSVVAENETQVTSVKIGDKIGKKVSITGRDTNYTVFNDASINTVKNTRKKGSSDSAEPIIAGKSLEKGNADTVLVGQKYLEKIGITDYKGLIGKEIELKVELPAVEGIEFKAPFTMKATISGIINSKYDEASRIVAPSELVAKVQEYYTGEKDFLNKKGYTSLNIECKSLNDVKNVNNEISQKLGYGTYASVDNADDMNKVFSVIKALLAAAGIIVLLVSAIGVINTMTMTVYEKTKSIGIMKAQGASRGHINIMFLVQSGVLGFVGGVAGSVLAVLGSIGLNKFVIAQLAKKGVEDIDKLFYTPIWAILAAIGFSIVVCLIAGIVPARRAAKLNPVDSLRYE